MFFPPEFLDQLRSRIPLSEIVRAHVRLKRAGQEFSGLCPFHKEKTPSFTVSDKKGFYHCFGCGVHGDIIAFVMEAQHLSFLEAIAMLASKAGLPLPKVINDKEQSEKKREAGALYEILEKACLWFQEQLKKGQGRDAQTYLEQRGFKPAILEAFRVGFAPNGNTLKSWFIAQGHSEAQLKEAGLLAEREDGGETYDRFRGRVMFPILDMKGRVVAFGGRLLEGGQPKYLNSPESPLFEKGRMLYGLNKASVPAREGRSLLLVEGYLDVMALHQSGLKTAVAPLGTALTENQIAEMWRYDREPILCFDGDNAGIQAAYRAAGRALPLLKPGYSLRFAHLPQGEDPDSLLRQGGLKTLEAILGSPRPLIDVLWELEVTGQPARTPEQQAYIQKKLRDVGQQISNADVRKIYQKEFNQRFFEAFLKNSRQGKGRAKTANVSAALPRAHLNPLSLQEKTLFICILNHPQLLHDVGERFALMDIQDAMLHQLREEILLCFIDEGDLDKDRLSSHLLKRGHGDALEMLLNANTAMHTAFARLGASYAQVLEGWKEVWDLYSERRHLRLDAQQLQHDLAKTMSLDAWQRFHRLKAQTLDLMSATASYPSQKQGSKF